MESLEPLLGSFLNDTMMEEVKDMMKHLQVLGDVLQGKPISLPGTGEVVLSCRQKTFPCSILKTTINVWIYNSGLGVWGMLL